MVKVKVCGLRTPEDARACRQAGVDLAGLNFVPGSRRRISLEVASGLIARLEGVEPVGVFRDAPLSVLREAVSELRLPWVQLHGSERASDYASLADRVRVIRAFVAGDPVDLSAWKEIGAIPLFDGPRPGMGDAFEWRTLRARGEFFVAGGLRPDNVGAAIAVTGATGVDTASGVEREGKIAADLVEAFVRQARQNTESSR